MDNVHDINRLCLIIAMEEDSHRALKVVHKLCHSMENSISYEIAEHRSLEVPSLIQYISSNEVAGFDNIKDAVDMQLLPPSVKASQTTLEGGQGDEFVVINHQRKRSISISMSLSSKEVQSHTANSVLFDGETTFNDGIPNSSSSLQVQTTTPNKMLLSVNAKRPCVPRGG